MENKKLTFKGRKHSEETKLLMSKKANRKPRSEETKEKMRKAWIGRDTSKIVYPKRGTPSLQHRIKISAGHKKIKVEEWKSFSTPLNILIRETDNMKQWRSDVFTRDKWTCQTCGERGVEINAHHIIELFKLIEKYNITNIPEAINCQELWDISNGVTLCEECHNLTKKYNQHNKKS
jgi:5-methylcytosine-specific restriction endonuclease McrA